MNINGFNPSSMLPQIGRANATPATGATADGSFGSAVKDAVDSLNQSQKSAEQEIARAVTGESPDLHRTIIALQTTDLGFQFALQVRNKVIGAYEEIMRMQV
jgi:flagellar hook-basal body complex protein FliE